MNNFSIEYFHKQLIDVINNSGLPVGIVYYILKDSLVEVEKLYNECIQAESQENNIQEKTLKMNLPIDSKEEMENEQSKANASTDSGSVNDN